MNYNSDENAQRVGWEPLTSEEKKLMQNQYKIDADAAAAKKKKRSRSPSRSPPAKKAKTSFFSIVVKDDDDDVIKQINNKYANKLKNGKIVTGTKIIKTTETPVLNYTDEDDAQAPPILQNDDIYVKVENNEVVDYNYHGNFSEKSYSPLPDGQPTSFGSINERHGWKGGRKTYKKKSRKTYKKKSRKTYKKKGKKTYKKKSRKHNKKRKTRKL